MSAPLFLSFPPVLARLIPRLASPHDGEVVATARAIERTLKAQKLDLHDLAAALIGATPPRSLRAESAKSAEIRAWLEAVARETWPNEWTAGFIDNILRLPTLDRLSKKQLAVANNIVSEACRRGVRVDRRAA